MIKAYCVVNKYMNDENRRAVNEVCEKYGYDITYFDTAADADGKVSDGEVIFCSNPDVLHQMKDLKWCHTMNAGVDSFVKSGIFDSGEVILTNSSGVYGRAISEHIIMVTLMLLRRMPEYQQIIADREWRMNLAVRSIEDSRIAMIGTGNIGSTAAAKFRALGAGSVIGFNRSGRKPEAFDEVYRMDDFTSRVRDIDVVVMCVPGTQETKCLMNAERIAAMPETAFFVNVGRGTAVDQDALIAALNEGRITGAALDVVVPEPVPHDSPLWTARNLILTPHSSGDYGLQYTKDTTAAYFIENLRRYAEGEELFNVVDPAIGY